MKKLTIGMPVYNGAASIAAALESLLSQTFQGFELVISDNGSSDDTETICRAFAARDPRVRYIRQPTNLGAAMNFRFVLFEAHTPYFMWAAADDLWAPTFIERNLAILEADPGQVLSQSRVLFSVNGTPSHFSTGTYPLQDTPRRNAARYFHNPADNSRYYGIFRTAALKEVFPTRPFYALDWLVAAATLRFGKHHEIPEVLMIRDSSDAAAYERSIAKDHRFILWQIFPLAFMTVWLLVRRLVPLSPALFYHLLKTNLYLHFRFGLYRIDAVGRRFLQSHSLRHALGLKAAPGAEVRHGHGLGPGLGKRLKEGAFRAARAIWRRLPIPLEQRQRMKVQVYEHLHDQVGDLATFNDWRAPTIEGLAPAAALAAGGWRLPSPPSATPSVSILLIAAEGISPLLKTLTSISALAQDVSHEVVIATSNTDVTLLALSGSGVGIVSSKLDSPGALANAGLTACRGEDVLILGGDLWLDPGAVKAVREALSYAQLAAGLIVYADGRVAAAGGVLSAVTGASRHHRLAPSNAPSVSYARACDYAPMALALKRSSLGDAPPFDPGYRDIELAFADFCISARSRVGAPRYSPGLRLGAPDDGPARASEEDHARLLKRHRAFLEVRDALLSEGRRLDDVSRARRVLYIDADTPTPDQNSGSIDAVEMLRMFRELDFHITFIPESNFAHRGRYTTALQAAGVMCVYAPFAQSVEQVLESDSFDLVVLCRAYIAERYLDLVRSKVPRAKVVFNSVDLHFLREAREAEMTGDAAAAERAAQTRASELRSATGCDAVIVLSSVEADLIRSHAPQANVHRIPLLRDVPDTLQAPGPQSRRDVVFVGTYQHPPNVDAANFLAREVWPLVLKKLPHARLKLVGSALTPEVQALESDSVDVLGYLPSLQSLLAEARVSVAPLRYGAGLKGKVASALQAGLPTVATSVAAEGMDLRDGEEALIADAPEAISDAIVRLYTNDELWLKLSANGFHFVKREFSRKANLRRVCRLLLDIGVPTLTVETEVMTAELEDGDAVYRPSKFWEKLGAEHRAKLNEEKLQTFKRSINNTYMQWLPGSLEDPLFELPLKAFIRTSSMLPIEAAARADDLIGAGHPVSGYDGFSPFSIPDYPRLYSFYIGLLWHLMTLHASDDLYETINEPALGAPLAITLRSQRISQDLAQSLLEYYRIKELTRRLPLPERRTYLELGAGYGRLGYVLLHASACRYIVVDIPPTLAVAQWYLTRLFPDRACFRHRPWRHYCDVREEIEAADIVFLNPGQMERLPDAIADVAISISSLHEMSTAQIEHYKGLLMSKTASAIYLKQWAHWVNPDDSIEISGEMFALNGPWTRVTYAKDLANKQFEDHAWLHNDVLQQLQATAEEERAPVVTGAT